MASCGPHPKPLTQPLDAVPIRPKWNKPLALVRILVRSRINWVIPVGGIISNLMPRTAKDLRRSFQIIPMIQVNCNRNFIRTAKCREYGKSRASSNAVMPVYHKAHRP
jgi:hypothetical protein